ncbi:MAG: metallophosphoesterase family protein [bacterium]
MRIGFLSDIHGNVEALDVALAALQALRPERLYCLGDIVGYGANPNECIEKVRQTCQAVVLGNHDAALIGHTGIQYFNSYAQEAIVWTSKVITEENLAFLRGIPLALSLHGLLMVHATPRDPAHWDYIFSAREARRHFEVMEEPMAFIGHSHIPAEFSDEKTGRRIINIGSVGQPRDGDPRLCCGLFDSEIGTFQCIREVYPVQDAAARIRRAGLPEFLAQRLLLGM